jgi:biopolymer transport protein ExbD
MSKELETFIINDEDSYMKESKYNFLNNRCFKKIDKKYKIGLAIFIAIILGLLFILIILAFHSSSASKIQKEQTEETKKIEESEEEEAKREKNF